MSLPKFFPTYDDDASHGKKCPSLDSLVAVTGDVPSLEGKIGVILFWAKYDSGAYGVLDEFSELAADNSDVAFVGVGVDPDAAQVKRYFDKGGKLGFAAAHDAAGVKNEFKDLAMLLALTTPHAFLINAEGNIVWREQFAQQKPLKDGNFTEQLRRLKAGEELVSNGPRPVEEESEDEEDGGDDDDMGALF